jgi:hypothetical protein
MAYQPFTRHSRRQFLGGTGAVASCLALGRPGPASAAPDASAGFARYFEALGYEPVAAHPLITLEPFNGGLRYDEMPRHKVAPTRRVYVQPCSRLDDIVKRGQPATLAYFHILALANIEPIAHEELLTQFLGFLVDRVGLAPQRLALVSTSRFEPYRPHLEAFGLAPQQLVLRSIEEAVRERDGSGFFGPQDHPASPEAWTASFHYALRGEAPSELLHPLPGHLELGEIVFAAGADAGTPVQEGGFGIERLLAARGEPVPSFEQSRKELLAALEAEARSRGASLPPGYEIFSAL